MFDAYNMILRNLCRPNRLGLYRLDALRESRFALRERILIEKL